MPEQTDDLDFALARLILTREPFTLDDLAHRVDEPPTSFAWPDQQRPRVAARALLTQARTRRHIVSVGRVTTGRRQTTSASLVAYGPTPEGQTWATHIFEQQKLAL